MPEPGVTPPSFQGRVTGYLQSDWPHLTPNGLSSPRPSLHAPGSLAPLSRAPMVMYSVPLWAGQLLGTHSAQAPGARTPSSSSEYRNLALSRKSHSASREHEILPLCSHPDPSHQAAAGASDNPDGKSWFWNLLASIMMGHFTSLSICLMIK